MIAGGDVAIGNADHLEGGTTRKDAHGVELADGRADRGDVVESGRCAATVHRLERDRTLRVIVDDLDVRNRSGRIVAPEGLDGRPYRAALERSKVEFCAGCATVNGACQVDRAIRQGLEWLDLEHVYEVEIGEVVRPHAPAGVVGQCTGDVEVDEQVATGSELVNDLGKE